MVFVSYSQQSDNKRGIALLSAQYDQKFVLNLYMAIHYSRRGMCRNVTTITYPTVTFLGVFSYFWKNRLFLLLFLAGIVTFLGLFFLFPLFPGFSRIVPER